jgi:SAM domain (Sterile alpha motif)
MTGKGAIIDIGAWLRDLGLEQYEATFRENKIGSDVLPKLTADDLKDLGVVLVGDRRRLLEAIARLRSEVDATAASPAEMSVPLPASPSASSSIALPPLAAGERRQVTVMFSDLVGSTTVGPHGP